MLCGAYLHAVVYFVTGIFCKKMYAVRYRVTWIGYPDGYAGEKTSSYVKLYENTRAVAIDSIIRSRMNVI